MNARRRRIADTAADLESVATGATDDAQANPRSHPQNHGGVGWRYPVVITVTSYRKRLCDADAISAKAAIDGLVHSGVLADDSPEYVREVRYRQVKAPAERTVIEISDEVNE